MKFIGYILNKLGKFYFRFVFYVYLKNARSEKIVVFDIDNTLANTWPFLNSEKSLREIYENVPHFPSVVEIVNETIQGDSQLLFLSARPYKFYLSTLSWLNQIFGRVFLSELILVRKPEEKLFFLEKLQRDYTVVFYDDMSYGHEKGKTQKYNDIIDEICRMDIKYIGYEELKKLHEND